MSSSPDNHDPAGKASPDPDKSGNDAKPPDQDSSVISVKMFKSPKGNVYKIIRTNEVDDYEQPPKAPGK